MLHIDTRELHPGLIMPACRLSRAEEREKEKWKKRDDEEEAEEDDEEEEEEEAGKER